ncbi:MAG: hypothetical protein ABR498_06065 [Candidatus Dormibacteria bacterium]
MTGREHKPPPDAVVTALVRAGVSLPTALAMERYKALEVLDLLCAEALSRGGNAPARDTI